MSGEPKKVYCKYCKWRGWYFGKRWSWCEKPANEYLGRAVDTHKKAEFNSNGECLYFKPSLFFRLTKIINN